MSHSPVMSLIMGILTPSKPHAERDCASAGPQRTERPVLFDVLLQPADNLSSGDGVARQACCICPEQKPEGSALHVLRRRLAAGQAVTGVVRAPYSPRLCLRPPASWPSTRLVPSASHMMMRTYLELLRHACQAAGHLRGVILPPSPANPSVARSMLITGMQLQDRMGGRQSCSTIVRASCRRISSECPTCKDTKPA